MQRNSAISHISSHRALRDLFSISNRGLPLLHLYVRNLCDSHKDPNSTFIKTMSKDSRGRDYLLWLINQLCDEQQTFLCGLSNLLDELERVSRNTSESAGEHQKDRISPWISRVLSDWSVISELEWRVSLHQPGIGLDRPVPKEQLYTEFSKRTRLLSTFYEAVKTLRLVDVGTLL